MTTTLAPAPLVPEGPPARVRPRLRRVRYEPEPGGSGTDPPLLPALPTSVVVGPVATPAQLAAAHLGVARVLRLALEVLDGRRPIRHLDNHVEESVLRYLRVAAGQRRVRSPARLRRMRLCLPRPGVAEVAVACDMDGRVRAIAARFELVDAVAAGRWRCTALRLG